tara:strand:- start:97 stop:639 length:543 start_codon:yes stop_codon:yes gene_type:complete
MALGLKKGKFVTDENDKVILHLTNCTILGYTNNTISIKSKSLERLCPLILQTEKDNKIDDKTLELTEHGIVMKMTFGNEISLSELIDKRYHYNIESRLHSVQDNKLCFKILKISDRKSIEIDVPTPDHFDVLEIRGSLMQKISKFKEKLRSICLERMENMNLQELIDIEDNLYEFIQKNI